MRFLLLIFVFYFYGNSSSIDDKLKQTRKEMVKSLDDINGTSKETISAVINSSFNLTSYKENYLLPFSYRYNSDFVDNGTHSSEDIETEYQVSIKYDFSSNIFGLGEIYGFGYTQRSWWQVYAKSAFFRESNYQPEFFVKIPTYTFFQKSFLKGFKISAIHESNGRGGDYERSWNRLSLSTFMQYKNLISEFEFWYRLPDNIDYNPDIEEYFGYGQLKLIVPYHKNLFKLRANDNLEKGSIEFTYTHPHSFTKYLVLS